MGSMALASASTSARGGSAPSHSSGVARGSSSSDIAKARWAATASIPVHLWTLVCHTAARNLAGTPRAFAFASPLFAVGGRLQGEARLALGPWPGLPAASEGHTSVVSTATWAPCLCQHFDPARVRQWRAHSHVAEKDIGGNTCAGFAAHACGGPLQGRATSPQHPRGGASRTVVTQWIQPPPAPTLARGVRQRCA